MRSSLGKTLVGTAVAVTLSIGVVSAGSLTTALASPSSTPTPITVADVATVYPGSGETISQDIGWHPEIRVKPTVVTVTGGDTLTRLAVTWCGTPSDWPGLFVKNQGTIGSDPDSLKIGQSLTISCDPSIAPPAPAPKPRPKPQVTTVAAVKPTHHSAGTTHVSTGGSGFEACVIRRESGGNPRAVNPSSGAGGLYQFLPSTWHSLGYSGLPEDAPVSEQQAAFAKEYAKSGSSAWGPYDGC